MSDKKDGGYAFPQSGARSADGLDFYSYPELGMTLRDWFAGQALSNPAICTGQDKDYNLRRWFGDRGGITSWQIAAAQALEFADAMIAERSK